MTITEEAKLNADVSNPYVKNAQVVVTSADKAEALATAEGLAGLTVAAEMGSAGAAAVTDSGVECNLVEVDVQTTALLQVVTGKADACVIDITMANNMTGEGTSYAELGCSLELSTEEYGISFRKGSDVTAKVNDIIAELKADGTLQALADKYELNLAD
jgi:polar amino acid transport system substrate-binding protein